MTSTVTNAVADLDADIAAATVLSGPEQEELIRAHMPLVGHLVRDMLTRIPNHVHRDDLTSAGLHALVTAARGWDPDRGIPFHRFATTRIRGAILDELRRGDLLPRRVRQMARKITNAIRELETQGETASDARVAMKLGVTPEHYRTGLAHLVHVDVEPLDEKSPALKSSFAEAPDVAISTE